MLDLGPITIRWYGFFIAMALLIGLIIVLRLAKDRNIKSDTVYDLALCVSIGGILGARLYDVFVINWDYYSNNLSAIPKVWEGGLAIHGALIGGILFLFLCSFVKKINFFILADLVAVVLPLGQALGRFGNYFNNELFGGPTNLFFGIPVLVENRPLEYINFEYFHPTFLYESILNLILFGVLLFLFKKGNLLNGTITALYLMSYSLIRIAMEFVRVDTVPLIEGLRLPQLVSMVIFLLASMFILFRADRNDNISKQ